MDFFDDDMRTYIEPSDEMKFYRATHPLPPKLIYSPFVRPELQEREGRSFKELPRLYQGTHLYCIDGRVLFFQGVIGAPATGIFLEELIALGITEIIFLGLAGAIQDLNIGDRLIPTEAVRFEGTSFHYLPASSPSLPSKVLTHDLDLFFRGKEIPITMGKICSTDAPFRETFKVIEKLRENQVLAIEMEVSAVFAIATFRKVEAAAVLVISDELKDEKWSRFQSNIFTEIYTSSFDFLLEFFCQGNSELGFSLGDTKKLKE
ncbi:MAG: nucleoside phosphorylase [Candidatus Heimdallarchaeota archaeon]|nr:MAG: nucleoside phosphorylase [Candidatus Heimdallarchaeota archaeon]